MAAVQSGDDEDAMSMATLPADDQVDPLDNLTHAEQIDQVRQAVEQLPEPDREVLYMRYTAGMSFAEIAEALDKPLGTVLARGHRALAKLRKLIEEEGAGGPRG